MQMQLPFTDCRRRKVFDLADDERAFIKLGSGRLPESFLADIRAKRLGISRSEFAAMRSYDRAREIAEEAAIIELPDTEFIRPTALDWTLVDAIAKREAQERAQDFAEYVAQKRQQQQQTAPRRKAK